MLKSKNYNKKEEQYMFYEQMLIEKKKLERQINLLQKQIKDNLSNYF